MLSNNEQKERKSRIAALVGTIMFHVLMLVVMLLFAFHTPLPLPGEEGVEVNIGYGELGMGDIQPEQPALVQDAAALPGQSKTDEKLVTDKSGTTPAIEKKMVEKAEATLVTKPKAIVEIPKVTAVNQKAMYAGKSTKTSAGGNQGITGKPGNQGSSDGTTVSSNNEGNSEKGNGVSFDLGGRGYLSLPKPTYNSPEQGKIVVSIKVNREGKVTYASAGAKGTTISEINLRQQAESAARKARFAPDADATEEQRGTITYVFVKQR